MIVKTFIGQDAKEIEERILRNYGPDAIILTSVEILPGQVEVSFGIEEEEFVSYQKRVKSKADEKAYEALLHEEDEFEDVNGFWDEETIPDVEYAATTNSHVIENAIANKIASFSRSQAVQNLNRYLLGRGLSSTNVQLVTRTIDPCDNLSKIQSQEDCELLESLQTLIHCTAETETLNKDKLLTVSSLAGVDVTPVIRKLVMYLQSQGKSVRAALVTEEHTMSQEYDIIDGWNELDDYINNYIHKCDHLVIICPNLGDFLEQWPSAHVLHMICALWKPEDIGSYLKGYENHKNSSLIINGMESTTTPGTILDNVLPPLRFLDQSGASLMKATPKLIAKAILWNCQE